MFTGAHSFREFMTIMTRSMTAGRHGAGAVPCS